MNAIKSLFVALFNIAILGLCWYFRGFNLTVIIGIGLIIYYINILIERIDERLN